MFYCEACKKDRNFIAKSPHMKSKSHIEYKSIYRINDNLTDKTYTHLKPDFEQVDVLVKRTIDDRIKYFHSIECESVIVARLTRATHDTTKNFTGTNSFQNQYE